MPSCAGIDPAPSVCLRVFNRVPALRPKASQMMTDAPCASADASHSFVPPRRRAQSLNGDLWMSF